MEMWKDIQGYEGHYQVSNLGRVKTLPRTTLRTNGRSLPVREKIRKTQFSANKYVNVDLYNGKTIKWVGVHRLVALAFIPNPKNKPQVNHLDGNPLNNNAENLEWCTASENHIHAYRTGLSKGKLGETNSGAKLTNKQVLEIRAIHKPFSLEFGNRALGRRYGVSDNLIYQIISRRIWKHI